MAGSKSTSNIDQHTLSVVRRNRGAGAAPKSTLTTPSRAENTTVPSGSRVTADVTGLALVCEANEQTVSSVIAVTGLGRVTRIELNALLWGSRYAASLALNNNYNSNNYNSPSPVPGASDEPLFWFHSGPLWALAAEKKATTPTGPSNNNDNNNDYNAPSDTHTLSSTPYKELSQTPTFTHTHPLIHTFSL